MKQQVDLCVELALERTTDRTDVTPWRKDRGKMRTKKKTSAASK